MTRRIITMVLVGIAPSLIAYAATAFAYWQIDPAFWSMFARTNVAALSVVIGAGLALIASVNAGDDA